MTRISVSERRLFLDRDGRNDGVDLIVYLISYLVRCKEMESCRKYSGWLNNQLPLKLIRNFSLGVLGLPIFVLQTREVKVQLR